MGHEEFRKSLREFLSHQQNVCVIGEAPTGTEVLQLSDRHRPHLILLDLALSKVAGRDIAGSLNAQYSSTWVVFVSCLKSDPSVRFSIVSMPMLL